MNGANNNGSAGRITLATKITIARILLVPLFVLGALYYIDSAKRGVPDEWIRWWTILVFAITAVTDALDGYLARSRREKTRLGTLLDPVADKLLLICGLIVLGGPWGRVFDPHLPPWYVLMVISRDLVLAFGYIVIHVMVGHVVVRPTLLGKASTFFQMTLILWVLSGFAAPWFPWVLYAAAICTLISTVQYVLDGVRQLEKTHDPVADKT